METNTKLNLDSYITLGGFVFVFIYLLLRAFYVPIVHDEAATFFHYIHSENFIPPDALWDANNHILNSALAYISYLLFGPTEFAIRLPSVISFAVFFFYVYRISTLLSNRVLKWIFIGTFVLAHNFIEYFALSRGYGMSMALLFASLWHLFFLVNNNQIKDYFLSTLFISFAVLANLTLINTAIIISSILIFNLLLNIKKYSPTHNAKAFLIISVIGFLPIGLFINLLIKFKSLGLLYYGTMDGFWELTVKSLMKLLLNTENVFVSYIVLIFFLISIGLFIFLFLQKQTIRAIWNSNSMFFLLLIGNFIAVLILGNVLGVNYPEDRTGLYFFPFFIGSFIFLLDIFIRTGKSKLFVVIALPLLFFPLHFFLSLNITHSSFWKNERIASDFITKVKEDSKDRDAQATIGGSHIRVLCWAFQSFKVGGELNQIQSSVYPEVHSDYQIVDMQEDIPWLKFYDIIGEDKISSLFLLKKKPIDNPKIIVDSLIILPTIISGEYFNLIKIDVDNPIDNAALLSFNFSFSSEEKPFIGRVVMQLSDSNNLALQYDYIAFDWKKTFWNGEKDNFKGSFIISNLPHESSTILLYIWNINKVDYDIKDIEISLSRFQ